MSKLDRICPLCDAGAGRSCTKPSGIKRPPHEVRAKAHWFAVVFQGGESASAEATSAQMAADLAFDKLMRQLSGSGLGAREKTRLQAYRHGLTLIKDPNGDSNWGIVKRMA